MTCSGASGAFTVKRGTLLRIACVQEENCAPVDLTGFTITASVRHCGGGRVFPLTVVVLSAEQGRFELTADTTTWPTGRFEGDIRFESADARYWTETFQIEVAPPVTT